MSKKYASWESNDKILETLTKINPKTELKKSGLPVMYDENSLYIDSRSNHSIVIGTSGSGKTQTIILPMTELARISNESVVVYDKSSEIYERTKKDYENAGYNVIKINFDNPKESNSWNPFDLIKRYYEDGDSDKATELIEELGYYLLNDINDTNNDPFWLNSAINYFTGITLYTLKEYKELNLKTIMKTNYIAQQNPNEFLKGIDKESSIYINLMGILLSPRDTMGSIFSVFNQRIKLYAEKENLNNMMLKSNFDISKVGLEKTIIYVISGSDNTSEHLIPILISQIYEARCENKIDNNRRINIILNDFSNLYPIKDFANILNYSRNLNIIFTIAIKGFNELRNTYGKEKAEIIKLSFSNIMYLLSKDIETLEEISKLCGNTEKEPLVTIEELKTLELYEGIYLTTRLMPFKTKLLPYYKMKQGK